MEAPETPPDPSDEPLREEDVTEADALDDDVREGEEATDGTE